MSEAKASFAQAIQRAAWRAEWQQVSTGQDDALRRIEELLGGPMGERKSTTVSAEGRWSR